MSATSQTPNGVITKAAPAQTMGLRPHARAHNPTRTARTRARSKYAATASDVIPGAVLLLEPASPRALLTRDHSDQVDAATLNRLGIVLNFLAAFLVGPELIGEGRLRRLEGWLERSSDRLARWLQRAAVWLRREQVGRFVTFGGGFIVLLALGYWWLGALTGDVSSMAQRGRAVFGLGLVASAVTFIGLPLLALALIAVARLLRVLVASLAGDDRLRGYAVALGIICLVVGNAMQLAATY